MSLLRTFDTCSDNKAATVKPFVFDNFVINKHGIKYYINPPSIDIDAFRPMYYPV